MKPKLLAIVGSMRKDGNSYALAKSVLDSIDADSKIIQLAGKEIEFCTLCEQCINNDCILSDDFNYILAEMKEADGIIFSLPKYLFISSKFSAFLERLDTIEHMRKHKGYRHTSKELDYVLFPEQKTFCIFALSGTGKFPQKTLKTVAQYVEALGLKIVLSDHRPFLAVNVKAGDEKGGVLKNKAAVKQCRELAQRLIRPVKKK